MGLKLKIGLAVGVLATATAISTASAGVFGSSTNACATGIYEGYCGTQQDESTPTPLYLAANSDGTIIGTSSTHSNGSEDFFWFNFDGGPNDIAEWAPFGIASNEVMTVVAVPPRGHDHSTTTTYEVVLEPGTGAANQQWTYNLTGWTNAAQPTLVLQTNGNGNPVTMVPAPTVATPNQTFNFVEGQ
jgi:hypothetical protein